MSKLHILLVMATICVGGWAAPVSASDWIVAPSFYTHDPATGQRVNQYTPIGPFYTYPRGDFLASGYRHTRSRIRFGGTADNYHRVEEFGRPVRPYGEWRLPYRPYSVPYQLWGPPFAGMYQFYYPGFYGRGGGRRPGGGHDGYGPGPGGPGMGGPGMGGGRGMRP